MEETRHCPSPAEADREMARRFWATLRWSVMGLFTLIFVVGFFSWLADFPGPSTGERFGNFAQWIFAMVGMVLVDIDMSLAVIKRKGG